MPKRKRAEKFLCLIARRATPWWTLIGVDDHLVFGKGSEVRDEFARCIDGDGIAIENQLVVAADGVAITDRARICPRERANHFAPDRRFVQG